MGEGNSAILVGFRGMGYERGKGAGIRNSVPFLVYLDPSPLSLFRASNGFQTFTPPQMILSRSARIHFFHVESRFGWIYTTRRRDWRLPRLHTDAHASTVRKLNANASRGLEVRVVSGMFPGDVLAECVG